MKNSILFVNNVSHETLGIQADHELKNDWQQARQDYLLSIPLFNGLDNDSFTA